MATNYKKAALRENDAPEQTAVGDSCGTCSLAMAPSAAAPTAFVCRWDPPPHPAVQPTDWCSHFVAGVPVVPTPDPPPATLVPPVNVDAPYIAQTANTISSTMGNWEGEPLGYKYDWRMDGVDVGPGVENPNYIVASADIGKTCTCIVTARNDGGETSVTSNAIVVLPVDTPLPANTAIPYVSQIDDTLSCTMGEWTGTPTSYAYQWQIDGVDIPTAGAADYVIAPGDVGRFATCVVTATNMMGSTAAPVSNKITVAEPAPARSSRHAPHRDDPGHYNKRREDKED